MPVEPLPVSNVTIAQVQRLRNHYDMLCARGGAIVVAAERDPSPENLEALMKQVKAVDLAYKLWDQAHHECYGF